MGKGAWRVSTASSPFTMFSSLHTKSEAYITFMPGFDISKHLPCGKEGLRPTKRFGEISRLEKEFPGSVRID